MDVSKVPYPIKTSIIRPVNEGGKTYKISDAVHLTYFPMLDEIHISILNSLEPSLAVQWLRDFQTDLFHRPIRKKSFRNENEVIHIFKFQEERRTEVKTYLHEKYGLINFP